MTRTPIPGQQQNAGQGTQPDKHVEAVKAGERKEGGTELTAGVDLRVLAVQLRVFRELADEEGGAQSDGRDQKDVKHPFVATTQELLAKDERSTAGKERQAEPEGTRDIELPR